MATKKVIMKEDTWKGILNSIRDKAEISNSLKATEVANVVDEIETESRGIIWKTESTTVRTSASATANYASNPNLQVVTEETEATVNAYPNLGVVTRTTDINGNPRIFKRWTIAEMNQRWVANGYKIAGLSKPIGMAFRASGIGYHLVTWGYDGTENTDGLVDQNTKQNISKWQGIYVGITGMINSTDAATSGNTSYISDTTATTRNYFNLRHSFYNTRYSSMPASTIATRTLSLVASLVGTGAGKLSANTWSSTLANGIIDLYEANTGHHFRIAQDVSANKLQYTNTMAFANAWNVTNFMARTEYLYQYTEFCRHAFAVRSGITTNAAEGTYTSVEILNASGKQAAVGEDFYFWIGGKNTGLLAKYNENCTIDGSTSTTDAARMTAAFATNTYNHQKATGTNMNDTGVNSGDRHMLTIGSKGAEAVCHNGEWMIITPYVSYCDATLTFDRYVPDAPAVYYAKNVMQLPLGLESILAAYYPNRSRLILYLLRYLRLVEGWFDNNWLNSSNVGSAYVGSSNQGSASLWSAVRTNSVNAWSCSATSGYVSTSNSYSRSRCVGCSALN